MGNFINGLLPYLPTIVALVAIVVGYSAWKRQLVGTRIITLLEDVLTSFYNARDAIAEIRSLFILEGEGSSFTTTESSPTQPTTENYYYNVFFERYSRYQELFNLLQVQKYRFMATYGAENEEPFIRLNSVINELLNTNSFLNHPKGGIRLSKPPLDEQTKELIIESKRILYASPEDPIKPKVDDIIVLIEKIVNNEMKRVN